MIEYLPLYLLLAALCIVILIWGVAKHDGNLTRGDVTVSVLCGLTPGLNVVMLVCIVWDVFLPDEPWRRLQEWLSKPLWERK